jgi:hypothetical protein
MSQPNITPGVIGAKFTDLEKQIAAIEASVSNLAAALSGVGFATEGSPGRTSPIGLLPTIHSDQEHLARQLHRVQGYINRLERYVSGLPDSEEIERAAVASMAKALSPRPGLVENDSRAAEGNGARLVR